VVAAPTRQRLFTRPFLLLWSFSFLTFLAAFQLFPTLPLRILDLGGSQTQAGLFLTVYTWASALSAPLTGALADRVGPHRLMVVAAGSFVAFSVAYGFVTTLPWLLTVAVGHGVFWSGLLSSSGALVTDVVPETRRTEGLAYWGMAPTAAIAVAPAVGLEIYERGWRILTLEVAALSVVVAGLALLVPKPSEYHNAGTVPGPLVSWKVVLAAGTIFLAAIGYGGITSHVAVMATLRGLTPRSLFFTAFACTILLTRIVVGPIGDRLGPLRLLLPSLIVLPPALWILATARSNPEIVVAAILFGLGFGGAYPAFLTWILARTHPGRRAATFGSVLFALDIGIGSGSLAVGWVAEVASFDLAFRVMAGLAAFSIPWFLVCRAWLFPES
jgi:MFS family permease